MATTHCVGIFAFEGCLVIYFIQCGKSGPIKIGQTNNDVQERLNQLQTGCPYELKLLWVYTGDDYTESEIHSELSQERTRGEWFHPSGKVFEFINECLFNHIEIGTPNGRCFYIIECYDLEDRIGIKTELTGGAIRGHRYTTIYHNYWNGSIQIEPANEKIKIGVYRRHT
jgi:hypothetical protein